MDAGKLQRTLTSRIEETTDNNQCKFFQKEGMMTISLS